MTKKEQILDLFYNHHLKEVVIARDLYVSQPYVSKVIKANKQYIKEIENRKKQNAEKRKVYLTAYHKNYVRSKNDDHEYQTMKLQHEIDTRLLSYGNAISDENYKKCNSSAYKYNSKKERYEIDRKLKVSKDIPRYINMNVKLKSQKFKKPYYCV